MAEQEDKCPQCEGGGRVADTEGHEPWTFWSELPPGSDIAVQMGLVRPIECPLCHGTGRLQQ